MKLKMKGRLIILCSCFYVVLAKDYSGYQVLSVKPSTNEHREWLRAIRHVLPDEVDFWSEVRNAEGTTVDIMIPPHFLDQFRVMLNDQELDYGIMHHDVGETITTQHQDRRKRRSVSTDVTGFDYEVYHTYDEIQDWVNDMVSEYPGLVSRFELPYKSYEGRTISGVKIRGTGGSADVRPGVWFEGGIHAREWISPATVMFFTNSLLQNYTAGVQDVVDMFDKMEWYIVPCLNVDGYYHTWDKDRLWRKTRSSNAVETGSSCMGTDANRNFPFEWKRGIGNSPYPCSNVYRGIKAASELVIEGLVDFLREKKFGGQDFIWFIDWHSYSVMILAPWSYSMTEPHPVDYDDHMAAMAAYAEAVMDYSGTDYEYGPHTVVTSSPYTGASNDFGYAPFSMSSKTKGGIGAKYSFLVELQDEGEYGFLLPEDRILETGLENFYGLIAMGKYIVEKEGL